jgi:twitching motility protein PilT
VLVTGATGSGKTTTLAAMLDEINRTRSQHIVTIEDPIEVLHRDQKCIVSQREVGLDTESFGQALAVYCGRTPTSSSSASCATPRPPRSRCRRRSRASRLLDAAHAGRSETVGRLVEFFPPEKQAQVVSILAGVLRGVVSQRLLPRLGGGRSRRSR